VGHHSPTECQEYGTLGLSIRVVQLVSTTAHEEATCWVRPRIPAPFVAQRQPMPGRTYAFARLGIQLTPASVN
jgi:hypothetical protein